MIKTGNKILFSVSALFARPWKNPKLTRRLVQLSNGPMDSECMEMDLSTRQREVVPQENGCKMRVAKSVFSIRSLVDLGEGAEVDNGEGSPQQNGKFTICV